MRKPDWVIDKERRAREPFWVFGLHAVQAALANPARQKLRLVATRNALGRLGSLHGIEPEEADARRFPVPLDPGSVHQGAALEVRPLDWGPLEERMGGTLVLLDRVTDPHNVGAVLRSAEVFGAAAVVAPSRHSAPETGALAKAASGALERQPYIRAGNLSDTILKLRDAGYEVLGLAGEAEAPLETMGPGPVAVVLGAEGPGLRARTRECCTRLVRIGAAGGFGSLNVSNAAAVALYATHRRTE